MPLNRPTLSEISNRITTDLSTRLIGSAQALRRSVLVTLAKVYAGAIHLVYGYLNFIALQVFPDTAETTYLERWASIWGVTRKPATFAQGKATFTGTDGSSISNGTLLQRADGIQYSVDTTVVISGGTALADLTCQTADTADVTGNLDAAATLDLVSPIAGVNSQAIVDSNGVTGGVAVESDEALRARLLDIIQEPPHGGNANDYIQWALSIPGVTRAWVYPARLGDGTVGVSFVRDNDIGGILPSVGEVAEVQAYIDSVRPVTADVTVFAPTALTVAFTIDNLFPDTAEIRAAIIAELDDLFKREAEPETVLYLSHIRESISTASGEQDHVLVSPSADITPGAGQIPVRGSVTFT